MGLNLSGLFGSGKSPTLNVTPAGQLIQEAMLLSALNTPEAFGAREGALKELKDFEITPDFYKSYQPNDFEQALGTKYFDTIMPDMERSIKHNLSLSGMAYSPALADLISKRRSEVGVNVGQYLSELGQRRATEAISNRQWNIGQRTSISPIQDFLELVKQQDNLQNQSDYLNAANKLEQSSAKRGVIGQLTGAGLGALIGKLTGFGAGKGAGIGAGIGGLFGNAPVDVGTALEWSGIFDKGGSEGLRRYIAQYGGDPAQIPSSAFDLNSQNVFGYDGGGGFGSVDAIDLVPKYDASGNASYSLRPRADTLPTMQSAFNVAPGMVGTEGAILGSGATAQFMPYAQTIQAGGQQAMQQALAQGFPKEAVASKGLNLTSMLNPMTLLAAPVLGAFASALMKKRGPNINPTQGEQVQQFALSGLADTQTGKFSPVVRDFVFAQTGKDINAIGSNEILGDDVNGWLSAFIKAKANPGEQSGDIYTVNNWLRENHPEIPINIPRNHQM